MVVTGAVESAVTVPAHCPSKSVDTAGQQDVDFSQMTVVLFGGWGERHKTLKRHGVGCAGLHLIKMQQ